MMYKIVNGLTPTYLSDLLPDNVGENLQYQLRNNEDFRIPFARLTVFKESFLMTMLNKWNQLNQVVKDIPTYQAFKMAITKKVEPKSELLYYGSRWASIHHARIRIGCSKLNQHLCSNLHVIPSPRCVCGHEIESANHYFFHCPLFNGIRQQLMDSIAAATETAIDTNLLLYGDSTKSLEVNKNIFKSIHTYIVNSKRFEQNQYHVCVPMSHLFVKHQTSTCLP